MAGVEWTYIEDITNEWEYKRVLIEALREIAEQLARMNKILKHEVK